MKIVGYPTPGKGKARVILDAFCKGAGGKVETQIPASLPAGVVPAFYGVTEATAHLYRQARAEGRDWVYLDNAYFDHTRGTYFRATLGALQHHGRGTSDGTRFAALGAFIQPWKVAPADGHVLLCPQSDEFMRVVVGYRGSWVADTLAALQSITRRPLRVRPWNRDKAAWYATLHEDLANCWALVTYSSASSLTAMLSGVPAIVNADDCISASVTSTALEEIHSPRRPVNRLEWAQVVADQQWTLDEMAAGLCWKMMTAGRG